jgi:hypothetical protein
VPATGLVLVGRADCGLCDELAAELAALAPRLTLPALQYVDVDGNAELRRRYGMHVPVLLLDGVEVCRHRLDTAELRRLLRS